MMADRVPTCTGGDPPQCCQQPEPTCPVCGFDWVMPTLLAPGEWQCWNDACCAIWTVDTGSNDAN